MFQWIIKKIKKMERRDVFMNMHIHSNLLTNAQISNFFERLEPELIQTDIDFCIFSDFKSAKNFLFSRDFTEEDLKGYLPYVENGENLGTFITASYEDETKIFTPIIILYEFNLIHLPYPKIELAFNFFHEFRHFFQHLNKWNGTSEWKEEDANYFACQALRSDIEGLSELLQEYNWNKYMTIHPKPISFDEHQLINIK